MSSPPAPTISISLSLSPSTFRRSDRDEENSPRLTVNAILHAPAPITLDIRGPAGNGSTVLSLSDLSFEHFTFYDITANKPVTYTNSDDECGGNPGGTLNRYDTLTLRPGGEHVTHVVMEGYEMPVRRLKPGHEYRVTLIPVSVWWTEGTQEDLFKGKEYIEVDEEALKNGPHVMLKSSDELNLKVQA